MKIKFTKAVGRHADQTEEGKIHLLGPIDRTACGIALEDYQFKSSNKKIDCHQCIDWLKWAKSVSKIKE